MLSKGKRSVGPAGSPFPQRRPGAPGSIGHGDIAVPRAGSWAPERRQLGAAPCPWAGPGVLNYPSPGFFPGFFPGFLPGPTSEIPGGPGAHLFSPSGQPGGFFNLKDSLGGFFNLKDSLGWFFNPKDSLGCLFCPLKKPLLKPLLKTERAC